MSGHEPPKLLKTARRGMARLVSMARLPQPGHGQTVMGLASSSPGELRITSVFSCVARRLKACTSFMLAGCCWW